MKIGWRKSPHCFHHCSSSIVTIAHCFPSLFIMKLWFIFMFPWCFHHHWVIIVHFFHHVPILQRSPKNLYHRPVTFAALRKWGCKLDKKPLMVEGRSLANEKWHVARQRMGDVDVEAKRHQNTMYKLYKRLMIIQWLFNGYSMVIQWLLTLHGCSMGFSCI